MPGYTVVAWLRSGGHVLIYNNFFLCFQRWNIVLTLTSGLENVSFELECVRYIYFIPSVYLRVATFIYHAVYILLNQIMPFHH